MMAMALGCQHTFLRELEGANDLFEIGREPRVVLFYQPDEFSLQGQISLGGARIFFYLIPRLIRLVCQTLQVPHAKTARTGFFANMNDTEPSAAKIDSTVKPSR